MTEERDIAPEAGRHASVLRSGEVRGSGAGAGGGNPSEDYDTDEQGTDRRAPPMADADNTGTPAQGAGDNGALSRRPAPPSP